MIAYTSRTGNVRFIVSKLKADAIEITENLIMGRPFLLLTYTDGMGNIPTIVQAFLTYNAALCIGVVVSGNSNFGPLYGAAGDKIEAMYHIPLVRKLDLRGYQADYEVIQQFYEKEMNQ